MVFSISPRRSPLLGSRPRLLRRCSAASLAFVAAVAMAVTGLAAERRFRPPDDRPEVQADALEGIRGFSSERLSLYADIDPEIAKTLPPLADPLYDRLVETFGPPLPDPDGKPFVVTAFLMKDRQTFLGQGLIPSAVRHFLHGQHLGYAFWMDDQESPYYRRHLLLHEFTHCFMLAERPAVQDRPELWYLEGMAEIFGTHRLDRSGKLALDIMPQSTEEVLGIGRIEMIDKAVARGDFHSVRRVRELGGEAFSQSRSDPYAWGWALCHFLGNHPRYRERFRQLHTHRTDGQFSATFEAVYGDDADRLEWDWEWFITDLAYGLDVRAGVNRFGPDQGSSPPPRPLPAPATAPASAPGPLPERVAVTAAEGWQPVGLHVTEGEMVRVAAAGRVTLLAAERPWISEPDGITIEYSGGHPVGRLMGWIRPENPSDDHGERTKVIPLGKDAAFRAERSGMLYCRVNDLARGRADNTGHFDVRVELGK